MKHSLQSYHKLAHTYSDSSFSALDRKNGSRNGWKSNIPRIALCSKIQLKLMEVEREENYFTYIFMYVARNGRTNCSCIK